MARQTPEEKIMALLEQVKSSSSAVPAKTKDISKALSLFKKSQSFLEEAIALLEGGDEPANDSPEYQANVDKYPSAPYGRKANGTPKMASGKQALTVEANVFRTQYPELFGGRAAKNADAADTGDTPGHGGSNVTKKATKKK